MEIGFTVQVGCIIHLPDDEFELPEDFFEEKGVRDAYWAKVKAHLEQDLDWALDEAHTKYHDLIRVNLL